MNKVDTSPVKGRVQLHPVLVVLAMGLIAIFLTHVLPAGKYERHGKQVVPGSFEFKQKVNGLPALIALKPPVETDQPARAAGVVALFDAMPAGMAKSAKLIFMLMFVGGAFGIMRATGAIDAGVDRLLHLTAGNVYFLTAGLITLLACGSTFLGFSSEYIALIPLVLSIAQRLRLPNLFAPAIIALADFIGYTTSVTNPILLGVAQPIVGVPLFSGVMPRLAIFLILLTLGVGYVLLYLRRLPKTDYTPDASRLTGRQLGVLVTLVFGGAALVVGTSVWSWHSPEIGAAFIALGIVLALVGELRAGVAAEAFLEGMKAMVLPCLLIGMASGIGVLLTSAQVMDTIVHGLASAIDGHPPGVVAIGMMGAEMGFGVLIPSASAKAAISLPILAPVADLAGLHGQVTVTALLLGSGMTNMISPTNPLLLAFLATAKVDYAQWLRFIAPLFAVFCLVCFSAIYLMAVLGG